jgi:hypothetical protein
LEGRKRAVVDGQVTNCCYAHWLCTLTPSRR